MRCECGKLISRHMRGKCMSCRYSEIKDKPMYKAKPKKEQVCPTCGKTFWPTTNNRQIYCSKDCREIAAGKKKDPKDYKEVKTVCKECGKGFSYILGGRGHARERKYCSRKCSQKNNMRARKERRMAQAPAGERKMPPERIAKLPASPPGDVRTIPAAEAAREQKPLSKLPRILIPASRMPYRGAPTRDRAFDGNMQKVLFEKELL